MNIRQFCAKSTKKLNKIKRHSITCSHIWHFDISVLFGYAISESLVEKQQFRHRQKCMKMPKNHNKIKGHSITYSHTWHVNILECVY